MAAGVGGAARRKLGVDGSAGSGAPPAKPRAPAWVADFGVPSGMVDSTWAVAHQRGGKLHTAARVSTVADQNSP
jgi:hypothetical protein